MSTQLFNADSTIFNFAGLDRQINCVITDPPYGIDYASNRSYDTDSKGKTNPLHSSIENDREVAEALIVFEDVMFNMHTKFADEVEMYIFTAWNVLPDWMVEAESIMQDYDFKFKQLLTWDKGALGTGDVDGSWGQSAEFILYLKKGRRDVARQRSSVLSYARPSSAERIHPTEKPVRLLETLMDVSCKEGDLIVDPFAGSGSTLRAARNMGFDALGLEMDPTHYAHAQSALDQVVLF